MGSHQDNIEELLCEEKQAITAIAENMGIIFNAHLDYKSSKIRLQAAEKMRKTVSNQDFSAFWEKCISSFNCHIESLNNEPVAQEIACDKNCYGADDFDDIEGETFDKISNYVVWYDSVDQLKECYRQVEEEFLQRTTQRQECNKLFRKLCQQIEIARKTERPKRKVNLGRQNFEWLAKVINLQDQRVRELLPYLLTAYTFNFWKCRFLYKEKKLLWQIFDATDINTMDAPKIRKRIHEFSKIFSLALNIDELISSEDDDRPSVCMPISEEMKETPHIKYRFLLDIIFSEWCTIVTQQANELAIYELSHDIDIAKCNLLYYHYTRRD